MVVILELEPGLPAALKELIESLGYDCVASKRERDICQASHLIFPNVGDVRAVIRRIHLFNLYSILRMVKKPVLGLGNSIKLMFDTLPGGSEAGMGYFPGVLAGVEENYARESSVEPIEWLTKSYLSQPPQKVDALTVGSDVPLVAAGSCTTAVFSSNPRYAVCWERDIYFALAVQPKSTDQQSINLLRKFLNYQKPQG